MAPQERSCCQSVTSSLGGETSVHWRDGMSPQREISTGVRPLPSRLLPVLSPFAPFEAPPRGGAHATVQLARGTAAGRPVSELPRDRRTQAWRFRCETNSIQVTLKGGP